MGSTSMASGRLCCQVRKVVSLPPAYGKQNRRNRARKLGVRKASQGDLATMVNQIFPAATGRHETDIMPGFLIIKPSSRSPFSQVSPERINKHADIFRFGNFQPEILVRQAKL